MIDNYPELSKLLDELEDARNMDELKKLLRKLLWKMYKPTDGY